MRTAVLRALEFLLFAGFMLLCCSSVREQKVDTAANKEPLEISFLQLKNDADCILFHQGEYNFLIDTGEKQDTDRIVAFLQDKGVSKIDYLILTHPDQDHIGGALGILDSFQIKTVIEPYYSKENEERGAVNQKIKEKGIDIVYPNRTRIFSKGEIRLILYPPLKKQYRQDNNYSLAALVNHKNVNVLLVGDAEKRRLAELMEIHWPKISVLKVANHGRSNIASEEFLRVIRPDYAVATSKNADFAIKNTCKELDSQMLFTGNGTVEFESDGNKVVCLEAK